MTLSLTGAYAYFRGSNTSEIRLKSLNQKSLFLMKITVFLLKLDVIKQWISMTYFDAPSKTHSQAFIAFLWWRWVITSKNVCWLVFCGYRNQSLATTSKNVCWLVCCGYRNQSLATTKSKLKSQNHTRNHEISRTRFFRSGEPLAYFTEILTP